MVRRLLWVALTIALIPSAGCWDDRPAPLQSHVASPTSKSIQDDVDSKPPTAAEREESIKRIDAAILAHGGATKLAQLRTMILQADGTLGEYTAVHELQVHLPDRIRATISLNIKGKNIATVLAMNPKGAWIAKDGKRTELTDLELDDMRNEIYLLTVRTLTPLKNEEFILRPLPLDTFGDKVTADGVLVTQKGRPAIGLYFDSKTHLLIHLVAPRWNENQEIHRRDLEFYDHEKISDLMLPKVEVDNRDGRRYAYWYKLVYRFPQQIENSLFEQP